MAEEDSMTVKEMAVEMATAGTPARREAEVMLGIMFDEMTPEERLIAAEVLSAYEDWWRV